MGIGGLSRHQLTFPIRKTFMRRSIVSLFSFLAIALIALTGCQEPQNSIPGSVDSISVRVIDSTDAKTITPEGNVNISHYIITVVNEAEGINQSSGYLTKGSMFTVSNVPAGTWYAKVDAYIERGEDTYVKVASDQSEPKTVQAGASTTFELVLDTIDPVASGDVTVTLKMPAALSAESTAFWYQYTITGMTDEEFSHTSELLSGTTGTEGLATITLDADAIGLMQGAYRFAITVQDKETNPTLTRKGVDVMRLVNGLEAKGTIDLSSYESDQSFQMTITDKIGDILTPSILDGQEVYELKSGDDSLTVTLTEPLSDSQKIVWYVDGELDETVNADEAASGKYTLTFSPGNHIVTAIVRDTETLMSVGSVDAFRIISTAVQFTRDERIAGVAWDYGDPDPQLYRLYTSADAIPADMKGMEDPYGLVTVDITEEPVSSYEGNPGSSPFDEFGPWQDMKLVAMADGGEIIDIIGDGETIRAFVDEHDDDNMDFMVYLPDAYVRVIDDPENQMRYYYVSDETFDGAELQPASGHYIGRYDAMDPDISGDQSSSNKADEVYSRPSYKATGTQEVARYLNHQNAYDVTRKRNEGITPAGGKMYGGLLWEEVSYVQLLYLVEYANLNSQDTLGQGDVTETSGDSDDMPYHTGVIGSKTSGDSNVQYRYIEGLFGPDNTGETVENLLVLDRTVYTAPDEDSLTRAGDGTAFSQNSSGNVPPDWIEIETLPSSSGYISAFGYDEERQWSIGLPVEASGSSSTYACNRVVIGSGLASVRLSCNYGNFIYCGAWYLSASIDPSTDHAFFAARLSFR